MKYFLIFLALIGFTLFFSQAYAIGAPPPERASVSSYGVYDLDFNRIELVESGEQIQIIADVANAQDHEQPFVYSVSIADWTGRLIPWVYSGSITGVLSPQTGFSPSISWVPEKPGFYKAEISISGEDGESRLIPDLQTEFYVVGDMSALNENRDCNNDKEMVFKINYSKVGCVLPETLAKLLDRGWARWHIWYDDFFIEHLRQGPQDVDEVHAEFVKRVTMRDSKVGDVLFRKNFEYTCCTFVSNENDDPQNYKIVINFSIPEDKKQLVVEYDLRQLKVTDVELKDEVQLGGPIIIEPEPEPTYTLNEVHCFTKQIIYNDECIYVLTPTDEFPIEMTKYFLMVDDVIINFCEIEPATVSDGEHNSSVTLDRCFEISSYSISDVNVIKFQSTTPPTWINIRMENLTRYVELGSSPTFRVVESGWGDGCTSPTLEVYHMKQEFGTDPSMDDLIYKHRIVYSCPYYEPIYPPQDILRIWDQSDFPGFPICEKQGKYLIIGDSGYERHALEEYYCGIENEN